MFHLVSKLHRQQGMAAQLEKIVISSDIRAAKESPPHGSEFVFEKIAGIFRTNDARAQIILAAVDRTLWHAQVDRVVAQL